MTSTIKGVLRTIIALLLALTVSGTTVGGALAEYRNQVVESTVQHQEFVPDEHFFRFKGHDPVPIALLLPAVQAAREE
jgi:hypothetical protein